jgi:hypothetical protein
LGRLLTKTVGGTLNATTANLSTFTACYNGNIAGMQWSVPAESLGYNRSYIFGYDGLNRLSYADYCGWSGTAAVTECILFESCGFQKLFTSP